MGPPQPASIADALPLATSQPVLTVLLNSLTGWWLSAARRS
jgi:hypothetical protein